ncbi:MAG TPA: flagellar protein FlgN [Bacillales bacterium]|nr:flagellar protein FlgN [Bacillales bacterium]
MSAEPMIETMEALVSVHKTLNEHAKEKTRVLKEGDIKALEALMKKEEAAAAKLKELEDTRIRRVDEFLSEKEIIGEDVSMSQLLKFTNPEEERELLEVQSRLMDEIVQLKQQNALNQELIEQSLKFVDMSLHLFQPNKEPANYRHPDQAKSPGQPGRSLFDSQA